jgi:hypothetical protein
MDKQKMIYSLYYKGIMIHLPLMHGIQERSIYYLAESTML